MGRTRETAGMEGYVADVVKEEIRRNQEKDSESYFDSVAEPGPVDDEEQLAELFSKCTSQEGYYIKIYKRTPVPKEYGGRPMFLADIEQPEAVSDLESELMRLAQLNNWTDGLYELKLFQRGMPGVRASRRIPIQVPKAPITFIGNHNSNETKDVFADLHKTAQLIKELKDTNGDNAARTASVNPESIMAAVTEAYKAGVEAAKANRPLENPIDFIGVIKAMKELAPPQPAQSHGVLESVLKDIVAPLLLKVNTPPLASIIPPQPDMLAIMRQMKELGLFGNQEKVDPTTKALEILGSLAPVIQSMSGGGSGEGSSPLVELIRVLGPQVGKMVSDVTGTVKEAMTLKAKGETIPYTPPSVPITIAGTPPSPIPNPQEQEMLRLLSEIRSNVLSNNQSYFPKLQDLVISNLDETTYENIINGVVPIDGLISQLKPYIPEVDSPNARAYFAEFITWAKGREKEGTCKACGEVFTYVNEDEMKKDPHCSTCGGEVE